MEISHLHIKNILSENGTDFINNYLGLDPELTYTDFIDERLEKANPPDIETEFLLSVY